MQAGTLKKFSSRMLMGSNLARLSSVGKTLDGHLSRWPSRMPYGVSLGVLSICPYRPVPELDGLGLGWRRTGGKARWCDLGNGGLDRSTRWYKSWGNAVSRAAHV